MGMAASQARFLGLTARKSNIEYEGQQINQQRTALANESAQYYNQMLTLQVPVPPSTNNFTKIEYTFKKPTTGESCTIAQITQVPATPGQYTVVFTYEETSIGFNACTNNERTTVVKHEDFIDPRYKPDATPPIPNPYPPEDPRKYVSYDYTTIHGKTGTMLKYDPVFDENLHGDAYASICPPPETGDRDDMFYTNVGTDAAPVYQYYKKTDLENATATGADGRSVFYTSGENTDYKTDAYSPCTIERDANNRVVSITYSDTNIGITTNTITDHQAYEDAYNQYTYETYLYNKSMEDINSETEVIQAQDKQLELRLKQLDTEHSAIQTEMEAVTSVLDKNAEDTFKTFA